ncbi:DGQHR domain-containing protein [Xanthomonas phaseoli]|uniref:DGQHR domain-containing protein n=1 Tax=Xanthomonas phaseoli TaxID=1985254 RepID=UPI0013310945|nr:DNA sulfur modification protein DndB [Xanthomonas phaseoli]
MKDKIFLPSLQGSLGSWLYYSSLISLQELAERVGYASRIQSNEKLGTLMQRALDDKDRTTDLAEYLRTTEDRFFNSLVVGVQGGAPVWHPFGLSSTLPEHDLGDIIERDQDLVGYLELRGDEVLFALDGQHRLSGIKKALETGADIGDEKVSVIFVPHTNSAPGLRKTRSLFIALNKRAVPVARRDIIALDEVDLPAIITRQLIDEHPWFSKGQVDTELFGNSIPRTSGAWTTIGKFYDVNSTIVKSIAETRSSEELKLGSKNRLPDERIDAYKSEVVDFYRRLALIDPVLKTVFDGKNVEATSKMARGPADPRLLFRPIGMKIVADTCAALRTTKSIPASFQQLAKIPMTMDARPFNETIWDEERGTMVTKGSSLAIRLTHYMLGIKQPDDKLRQAYAEWRGIDRSNVRLPNRWN